MINYYLCWMLIFVCFLNFVVKLVELCQNIFFFCFVSAMFTPEIGSESGKLIAVRRHFPPKVANFGTLQIAIFSCCRATPPFVWNWVFHSELVSLVPLLCGSRKTYHGIWPVLDARCIQGINPLLTLPLLLHIENVYFCDWIKWISQVDGFIFLKDQIKCADLDNK